MYARRLISAVSFASIALLAGMAHGSPGGPVGVRPARTASQQEPWVRGAQKYVPGQLLVRFRRGTGKLSMQAEHARVGAEVLKEFRIVDNLQLVRLPAGMSVRQAERYYRQRPDVLYAEPNYIRHIDQAPVTPNDPQYSTMWSLNNTGQLSGTPDADIDAPEAWGITTGSATVVVGVIDSGIDYNHIDLNANMFRNAADCNTNGVDDDGNGYVDDCYGIDTVNGDSDPMDDEGHGTHVSGTIGAVGNNSIGVVGVNWTVRLMACKFLDSTGSGSTADAIKCVEYFALMKDRGVNIVATNNSYGGGDFSQAEMDAIDAQRQRGILFIVAAGNSGEDSDASPQYPANYYLPNIIAVANTNRNDGLRASSNFGRHSVHLGAPGTEILSTVPGNNYTMFTGTSMSAPHVTGVAALLKAQNPARDWKAIKNLILAGGDTKPSVVNTITQKRLNAHGAMTCSNSIVLSRLQPVASDVYATAGRSQTLAALHINCAAPNGSVQVNVDGGASTITLNDDGLGADQESGDGIYSAQQVWLLAQVGDHTLTFPNSDVVTVHVIPPLSPYVYSTPVPFNYRTITGTNLNLSDDSTAQITPPFPVLFGGASFSKLTVSSNGDVTFLETFSSPSNNALPISRVITLAAPWWDDLYPIPGSSSNIFWDVLGSAPNRELVIEWRDVEHYNCDPGLTVKFQIVFFEGSSDILFNYADTAFTNPSGSAVCYEDVDHGASATVGVQVDTGLATQFSFDTPSLTDNSAILWQIGQLAPVITQISPFTTLAGDPALTLRVTGTNFFSGSVVRWNGSDRPTTFVNAGELTASIPSTDLAAAAAAQITVFNPPPNGSGESAPMAFNVYSSYPAPTLTSVTPDSLLAGSSVTLTLTGANFVSASVARWNGSDRALDPLSPTLASLFVGTSDTATAGTAQVTVFTPAPGGGTSDAVTVNVTNPVPSLDQVYPVNFSAGSPYPPLPLFVIGSNFVPNSILRWNGSDRTTTFYDTRFLTADILASDIATPGTAQVSVFNPPPGGGTTVSKTVTIVAPPPNDNFANATVIASTPHSSTIDTRGATEELTDPSEPCVGGFPFRSVWFRFTPPSAGVTLTADTAGSNYDTVLTAWAGSPGSFTNLGCNDDDGLSYQSRLQFAVSNTNQVYFMVSASSPIEDTGTLVFNLNLQGTFALSSNPTSRDVSRGTTASYTITVSPQFGSFNNPITLSCSVVPVGPTCSLSPASVTPGGAAASVTLTVATTNVSRLEQPGEPAPLFAFWLALPAVGLLAARRILPCAKKARLGLFLALVVIVAMLGMQTACGGGGGGGGGTPPPPQTRNFTITVTGTSGTISQQTSAALTVTF